MPPQLPTNADPFSISASVFGE